jgi:N-acetyl-beta-hexosaminidase/beta-glucosidase-like glycosyl hydrolase
MKRSVLAGLLLQGVSCLAGASAPHAQTAPPLIPMPAEVRTENGSLAIDAHTVIAYAPGDTGAKAAGEYLAGELARSRGLSLPVTASASPARGAIVLRSDPKAAVEKPEGYALDIGASGARISARSDAGLFYGAVTLWQLATADGSQGATHVPNLSVRDWPRFAWRGLMLDAVRHFRDVATVKQVLDTMAEHKLNVFHWHLTDDQGWRIEIKRYPKLTTVGAWRTPPGAGTHGEPDRYGGFYTQAEVREVVAYAAARHITVVPELDMPGHAQAAVAAYPELVGVTGERPKVSVDWGVNPYLYNVDDKSFTFIENVLDEVMALFPSTFIHLGGDEAVKDQWKDSPAVQAKMKSLGIADENALQSWFTDRLGDYLGKHGRRLIGWDEILEGGIPRTASVMSWRGVQGAIDAAKKDHDVVLAPAGWMYFDNLQSDRADEPNGRLSVLGLERVYGFEPVDASLAPAQAAHVLGTEATLWAEFISSTAHVQHALYPRLDAMSEIAWSPKEARDWHGFLERLPAQYRRYAALGIVPSDTPFAPAIHVDGAVPAILASGSATVRLDNQTGFGTLRYTMDGSTPDAGSTAYTGAFKVTLPATVRAVTYAPDGTALSAVRTRTLDGSSLLSRRNGEFAKCPDGGLGLRMPLLPDLGGMDTPVYDVDLFHSCWVYPAAPLDGITRVRVDMARLPRNYGLAHDQSKVVSYPAKTAHGELEIHQDTCAGALLASLPLPPGKALGERFTLEGALPRSGGEHDLCLRVTAPIDGPLYGLGKVQLAGAAGADSPATPGREAADLVARMSLEEKVAQLQSAAPALPRLGIPAYEWWNEGLHGAARAGHATVFPQAIGLAATWDPDLLRQVGAVVSREARARFDAIGAGRDHGRYEGLTIWSPNVNIFRDPRWGRGQETYGEDPYLTGRLAVGFVQGVQGPDPARPRAIATPKHFAVHSGPEAGRHGFDVDVSPHDLEATFLPAFRAAVTEGHAGSVMCAYNALHGTPVCADAGLLGDTLRRDWGFTGYVVSDCDAIDDMTKFHYYRPDNAASSAAAIRAGTDLDCGFAYADLVQAVRRGDVAEPVLDTSLVRLFAARYRLGELGSAAAKPEPVDTRANAALSLRAALESMVLLKNENGALPLRGATRIAVIGPNADTVETLEANYHGTPRAPVTPLLGLRARFGTDRVRYAQGSPVAAGVPVPVPETALRAEGAADGPAGLTGHYFAGTSLDGEPARTRVDRTIDFDWDHVTPAGLPAGRYAVRWTGSLLPPGPGDYTLATHVERCFDCAGHDPVRLYVDGKLVIDDAGDDRHTQATLHFADTSPHALRLEYVHRGEDQGVRLQWLPPPAAQLAEVERAVASADVAVAFVGLSPDVEGEELHVDVPGFDGGDRTDIGLPPVQQALLERAAAGGKPLVVVLMSGSAVALNWAQAHASAILAAWYPGESGGTAIAQVLSGDYNPAGRLPVTFYRSVRDLPPFTSYQMKGRTYRYFQGSPLYPFGHGLSYTSFAYGDARASATTLDAGQTVTATVTVRNSGDRAGDEVVQAYLSYPDAVKLAPVRSLVGLQRVHLAPGESRTVSFPLDARRLSSVDAAGKRAVVAGNYRLFIGGGQPGDAAGQAVDFAIRGQQALPR